MPIGSTLGLGALACRLWHVPEREATDDAGGVVQLVPASDWVLAEQPACVKMILYRT